MTKNGVDAQYFLAARILIEHCNTGINAQPLKFGSWYVQWVQRPRQRPWITRFLRQRRSPHRSWSYHSLFDQVQSRYSFVLQQGGIHGYLSRVRLGRGSNKSLQALKQRNPRSKIDVTDRRTDGRTDIASYKVASTRLKIGSGYPMICSISGVKLLKSLLKKSLT